MKCGIPGCPTITMAGSTTCYDHSYYRAPQTELPEETSDSWRDGFMVGAGCAFFATCGLFVLLLYGISVS